MAVLSWWSDLSGKRNLPEIGAVCGGFTIPCLRIASSPRSLPVPSQATHLQATGPLPSGGRLSGATLAGSGKASASQQEVIPMRV
jgi:hypothetical protein